MVGGGCMKGVRKKKKEKRKKKKEKNMSAAVGGCEMFLVTSREEASAALGTRAGSILITSPA